LCAIHRLRSIGVNSLKIVSRGTKLKIKLFRLDMIKKVLASPQQCPEFSRSMRDNCELCETGYRCYYPETRRN
jgi:hypothetical protein